MVQIAIGQDGGGLAGEHFFVTQGRVQVGVGQETEVRATRGIKPEDAVHQMNTLQVFDGQLSGPIAVSASHRWLPQQDPDTPRSTSLSMPARLSCSCQPDLAWCIDLATPLLHPGEEIAVTDFLTMVRRVCFFFFLGVLLPGLVAPAAATEATKEEPKA